MENLKKIKDIQVKLILIKDEGRYILSVKQPQNIELKDVEGKLLKQSSIRLYDRIQSGLYFMKIAGIENEIRIRLK